MENRFSIWLQDNKVTRKVIAYLLVLTFFSIAFNGYNFGVYDHAVLIPFMKAYNDPSLYPNDFLLTQIKYYYTFFYYILAWLTKYIDIHVLFFATHCISIFLMYLSIFMLAFRIFKNKKTAYISALLFFQPQPVLAINAFDSLLQARTFVFPFLLFAIFYFLNRRYVVAFTIVGIMFNLHGMSASLVLFMFLFYFLLNLKKMNKAVILKAISIFLLFASPLLLWRFSMPSSPILYADSQWVEITRIRLSHHIFPLSWSVWTWIGFLLIPAIWVISLKHKPEPRIHRNILTFTLAILIMCLLGIVFTEFKPLAIVMNTQLLRSTKFFTVFAIIYISNYLITLFKESLNQKMICIGIFSSLFLIIPKLVGIFLLQLISLEIKDRFPKISKSILIFSLIGFFLILISSMFPNFISFSQLSILDVGFIQFSYFVLISSSILILVLSNYLGSRANGKPVIFTFIAILLLISSTNLHLESTQDRSIENDWEAVQLWCKYNTPKDSLFIIPPRLEGFRVFSERSGIGDWKDGALSAYNPNYAIKWRDRMRDLNTWDDREGYNLLKESDFERLACKYNATNIIIEKPKKLDLKLVYESEYFRIYEI
ncbi:MAG: hypothetical protein NWF08_08865, partial [Candidatus Bathyarchaeota archaeon]|nr:hypothetical protein [Candidatus Bathyarchaeota archaeon]